MTEIVLGEDDRFDWALKAFKRKVQRSGILRDLRKKRYYVKKSTAKRLKRKAAARRRRVAESRRGRGGSRS
jgi:small subunit ribosomal protein S21